MPVSAAAYDRIELSRRKLDVMTVLSRELFEDASPRSDAVIAAELAAAIVREMNAAFVDGRAEVAGVSPANICHGITPLASAGTIEHDIEQLLYAFDGDLEYAALLMHPRTANGAGVRAPLLGLGAKGGEVGGLPVVCSSAVPLNSSGAQVILVDCSQIV